VIKYVGAENVQITPANGKQGPAALANTKKENFDQICAVNISKRSEARINRKKYIKNSEGQAPKNVKPAANHVN
jgi:hypothetical protein